MTNYNVSPMMDYSKEQISEIELLEEHCKQYEQINLRVGIEHLAKDHAYLCHHNERLIGLLSWYTSDGIEANINGMVHPDYRRQGVFHGLLYRAQQDMSSQSIRSLRYRVVTGSSSGEGFVQHIEASHSSSEYSMTFLKSPDREEQSPRIILRPEEATDFEFVSICFSAAFNETTEWTQEYLAHTQELSRVTYLAFRDNVPVGLIRTNDLGNGTAVIHDFCVLPSLQGQGLGRAILVHAVDLLLSIPFTHIRLGVVTNNEHALNLYLSVGFEITAEFHYYVVGIRYTNRRVSHFGHPSFLLTAIFHLIQSMNPYQKQLTQVYRKLLFRIYNRYYME
ncbi:GNAT family N-acetyltransferase [Paenibacillus sp. FSL R10-2734]|uniref:GNAT family N-acetyltransferase n=1 Tax=Paenibacillus sp. FSL R10-2734 TaxID=2954691 RepID=UPI0030D92C98